MSKKIITEADILRCAQSDSKVIQANPALVIVTPKAREKAEELGIELEATNSQIDHSCSLEKSHKTKPAESDSTEPRADDLVSQVTELLKPHLPEEVDTLLLEKIIKETVNQKLKVADLQNGKAEKNASRQDYGRVIFIKSDRLLSNTEKPEPVKDSVIVTEAINSGSNVSMAGGYMQWKSGSFKRKLNIPEMTIVLQGVLLLDVDGKQIKAATGDMLYLPADIEVVYGTHEGVKLACINCIS